jgi:hypothetical protein
MNGEAAALRRKLAAAMQHAGADAFRRRALQDLRVKAVVRVRLCLRCHQIACQDAVGGT